MVYRDPKHHWDLYQLGEELTDLEDAFRLWRFRHVTTVERVIGFKRGTGGTGGVSYLRKMLDVVLFPEIWKLRTDSVAPPPSSINDQGDDDEQRLLCRRRTCASCASTASCSLRERVIFDARPPMPAEQIAAVQAALRRADPARTGRALAADGGWRASTTTSTCA